MSCRCTTGRLNFLFLSIIIIIIIIYWDEFGTWLGMVLLASSRESFNPKRIVSLALKHEVQFRLWLGTLLPNSTFVLDKGNNNQTVLQNRKGRLWLQYNTGRIRLIEIHRQLVVSTNKEGPARVPLRKSA